MVINIPVPDGLLEDLVDEVYDLLEITGPGNQMTDVSGNNKFDYLVAWFGHVINSITGTEILNLKLDGEYLFNKTRSSLNIYYEDVFRYLAHIGDFPLRCCLELACPDTIRITTY